MATLAYAGGELEYLEHGEGPPLVLVHGSFATAHSWKQVRLGLEDHYRVYALNMPGYGHSTSSPDVDAFLNGRYALQALLEYIGNPIHLVGHSAGGAVCLNAALHLSDHLRSLTVIEPTTVIALDLMEQQHVRHDIEDMFKVYKAHVESGEQHAARHVIDYWGGQGSYASFPEKFYQAAETMIPQNLREWAAAFTDTTEREAYHALDVPTRVICGDQSAHAMQQICANLVHLLPDADYALIEGARHFSPTTHAADLVKCIHAHAAGRR